MKSSLIVSLVLVSLLALTGCGTAQFYYDKPALEFKDFQYSFPTETAKINGIEIAYHDAGNGGIPLVLIHGLASNMGFFRYNVSELEKSGYRVIAIDLPGYGKSEKSYLTQYTLTNFSETVAGVLARLNVGSAVFIGHSMGGQIALVTALHHPTLVKKLVLLSPAGIESFKEGEGNWMRNAVNPAFIKNTSEAGARANLVANFYAWDDQFEWMVEERVRMTRAEEFDRFAYATWRSVGAMLDEPVWAKLPRIEVPTLIIAGENDNLIPNPYLHGGRTQEVMAWGVAQMKNARLLMVTSAGHMVQIEKSSEVNRAIADFCK